MSILAKITRPSFLLCVSLLSLIGAGFIAVVVAEHAPVFAAMKREGRAAQATVTHKEIRVTRETTRKGRTRETKRHFLTVSYDGMSVTPHAAAAAGGPVHPSEHRTMVSADLQVATADYEAHDVGAQTLVTYLPDKVHQPKLTAAVERYTPFWQIVCAIGLAGAAVGAGMLAWRGRRRTLPPPLGMTA